MNTHVIVVGYDGSSDSELALSWAEEMATEQGRPLRVLISEVDPTQVLEVTSEWHITKIAQLEADARERLVDIRVRDVGVGFAASAHLTAQIALAQGVDVHVLTRDPAARDLALTLGAASVSGVHAHQRHVHPRGR